MLISPIITKDTFKKETSTFIDVANDLRKEKLLLLVKSFSYSFFMGNGICYLIPYFTETKPLTNSSLVCSLVSLLNFGKSYNDLVKIDQIFEKNQDQYLNVSSKYFLQNEKTAKKPLRKNPKKKRTKILEKKPSSIDQLSLFYSPGFIAFLTARYPEKTGGETFEKIKKSITKIHTEENVFSVGVAVSLLIIASTASSMGLSLSTSFLEKNEQGKMFFLTLTTFFVDRMFATMSYLNLENKAMQRPLEKKT